MKIEPITEQEAREHAEAYDLIRRFGYSEGPDGVSDEALVDFVLDYARPREREAIGVRLRESRAVRERLVATQAQLAPVPNWLAFVDSYAELQAEANLRSTRSSGSRKANRIEWLDAVRKVLSGVKAPANFEDVQSLAEQLRLVAAMALGVGRAPHLLPAADLADLVHHGLQLSDALDASGDPVSPDALSRWQSHGFAVLDGISNGFAAEGGR